MALGERGSHPTNATPQCGGGDCEAQEEKGLFMYKARD